MIHADRLLKLDELLEIDLEAACRQLAGEFGEMSGRSLMVTGGAGFLGYYWTLAVLHWNRTRAKGQPIRLVVVDNFKRGVPAWLDSVRADPNLVLRTDDMCAPLPGDFPYAEYVIHAAGIASPPFYRRWPLETIDANINGLRNLLEAYRHPGPGRPALRGFVFMSSSEIYGDPPASDIPTPETFRGLVSCTGPRACYDESKRFGETLCVVYAQQYGLPVKMARPFNNYGPGLKITDRRVLPDFMRAVIEQRDIVMLSDGSPTRTFCYATDAIAGYYKVLVRGRPGEAYNVGTERPEVTMASVADRVRGLGQQYLGYPGKVIRGVADESDYLVDNPNRRCPVIDKSRADLGYDPQVGLEDGLYRMLSWYSHFPTAAEA